jgi:hypothetical protein
MSKNGKIQKLKFKGIVYKPKLVHNFQIFNFQKSGLTQFPANDSVSYGEQGVTTKSLQQQVLSGHGSRAE